MSIRRVRRLAGLGAFVLGLALVLSSLLFPWVCIDLGPGAKAIFRRGHEIAPYAPVLAAGFVLIGVVQARVRSNRDLGWISLLVVAAAVLLFAAFVADRAQQRDLEFIELRDLPVKSLAMSHGFYMFLAAGVLFAFAGYAEYASRSDPARRRKRRSC